MAGINKVTILGRLGRDPETRNFQNGGKVVNLRIATSERFKDRDGNQQERTEWHSVAIFNDRLADVADKYLRKGSEVYVEGQLETRKWQDQSGQDRYTTEIVLRQYRGELQLVGGGGGNGARRDDAPASGESAAGPASSGSANGWDAATSRGTALDDEIPF